MAKLLIAVFVAWLAWYLWVGPKKYRSGSVTGYPDKPDPRPVSPEIAQARALLGVDDNADEAAIRAAHRKLVAEVHPDRGGSAELTRRVNAARDTLLPR